MKLSLLLSLMLFSGQSLPNDQKIKQLMNSYLKSLHHYDTKLLKKISTPRYYQEMSPKLKSKSTKHLGEFKPYTFDLQIKKALETPNMFFVKIKDKKKNKFGDYAYIIIKQDRSFVIDSIFFEEE